MGTFLLIFNNTVYESADSSGTSWVQEPFPGTVAPNGVLALATTVVVSGWVFDSTAALWSRADQTKFSQLAKGDLSPTLFDFYASRDGPGARVVGNIGAVGGQQSNVQSFDGGVSAGTFSFGNLPLPPGSTLVRLWADEQQLSPSSPGGFFLAQVRDSAGVDRLYTSQELQSWTALTVKAPRQASLLVASGLNASALPFSSQFLVGASDNWRTNSPQWQQVTGTSVKIGFVTTDVLTYPSLIPGSPGKAGKQYTTPNVTFPVTDSAIQVVGVLFDTPNLSFSGVSPIGIGTTAFLGDITGVTQDGWTYILFAAMSSGNNVFPGGAYGVQWNTPQPTWGTALVCIMVLDFVGNHIILSDQVCNAGNGQDGSPVTVSNGAKANQTDLQLMLVLTDGATSNLANNSSQLTVPTGGPDPVSLGVKNIRGDFIRKQNGTYLVAVDLFSGTSAIARSADGGVTWTFNALPNTAPPMRGLTECNDGTVLVPTDGSAGPGLVFRSTDDGQTFQVSLTPSDVTTAQVGLKYFVSQNTLFAYVAQLTGTAQFGTAVYKSTDQGQSWGTTQPVFTQATSAALPSQQSTSWMAVTPGETHWGVDSSKAANLPQGTGFPTLYDAVVSQGGAGRAPAFWGRYIGPKNGNLLQSEVDFLHDPTRNCKVLLIYNDTYFIYPGQTQPRIFTYPDGQFHATQAIKYIGDKGLTVPGNKRVWIYLDTEVPKQGTVLQSPTADCFQGWSDTMFGSIYGGAGGVYGNTNPQQDFDKPYCLAYNNDANMRVGSAPALLYSNQPNQCAGPKCNPQVLASTPPAFSTVTIPQCNPGTPPVVVFQYAIDLTLYQQDHIMDFDLANGAGFAGMW